MRFCLTIDVDWAPDFVIEWMADRVNRAGVRATWFVTHNSPVLRKIAADATQEIGLHPNFLPGSTQGAGMEDIMGRLFSAYPDARGVRAHALLDSTRHQRYYSRLGLKYMSNVIFWRKPAIPFFLHWSGIWQIPISWEDDVACAEAKPLAPALPETRDDSLWVLAFHPLYCYLNERPGMNAYAKVKGECDNLMTIKQKYLNTLRCGGSGLAGVLDSVLAKADTDKFLTLNSVREDMEKA